MSQQVVSPNTGETCYICNSNDSIMVVKAIENTIRFVSYNLKNDNNNNSNKKRTDVNNTSSSSWTSYYYNFVNPKQKKNQHTGRQRRLQRQRRRRHLGHDYHYLLFLVGFAALIMCNPLSYYMYSIDITEQHHHQQVPSTLSSQHHHHHRRRRRDGGHERDQNRHNHQHRADRRQHHDQRINNNNNETPQDATKRAAAAALRRCKPISVPLSSSMSSSSSSPPAPSPVLTSTSPNFAYVFFVYGHVDGGSATTNTTTTTGKRIKTKKKKHKKRSGMGAYVANMVITAKLLKQYGSTSDVVAMFLLNDDDNNSSASSSSASPASTTTTTTTATTLTTLPLKYERLLEYYGIKIVYLSDEDNIAKVAQFGCNKCSTLSKFNIYRLTQYDRITFLDGDVIPLTNLDYMMQLSYDRVLASTVTYSTIMEPANAGYFIITPNATQAEAIMKKLDTYAEPKVLTPIENGGSWNETLGWGHIITPPDMWISTKYNGSDWNFLFAHMDQGFLYYWAKYVEQSLTSFVGEHIITYGGGMVTEEEEESHINIKGNYTKTMKERVGIMDVISFQSIEQSPLYNHSIGQQPSSFRYNFKTTSCKHIRQSNICPPPYSDFAHFTGPNKPWSGTEFSSSFFQNEIKEAEYVVENSYDLWWYTFDKILTEQQNTQQNLTWSDFHLPTPTI
jgi:hypothetical protein